MRRERHHRKHGYCAGGIQEPEVMSQNKEKSGNNVRVESEL